MAGKRMYYPQDSGYTPGPGKNPYNAGPNAVYRIDLPTGLRFFFYDANGNMIRSMGNDNVTDALIAGEKLMYYTSDNKVCRICLSDGTTIDYAYDGNGQRVWKSVKKGSRETITYYMGKWFERKIEVEGGQDE